MQIVTLVTDFGTSETYVALGQSFAIWINECQLDWRWCASYGFAPAHAPIALIGSHGYLELAVNGGSAAKRFNLHVCDRVRVCI